MANNPFKLAGHEVMPGQRLQFDLPAAQLFTHTPLDMPVEVFHGKHAGPVLLVCGAIHGNELNGVEIIRRLRTVSALKRLRGTLVLVPVVNLHGFINKSRYLPDRRDLNRCFPGNESGSLGSRLAYLFFNEVVRKCTHVIDLHTAAIHRDNLPQIRADLTNPDVREMALGFRIPVIVNAGLIENSLRAAAGEIGISVITYEAGEALRLTEREIVAGVRGVMDTMRGLGMLSARRSNARHTQPNIARATRWFRAPNDGVFRPLVKLGDRVSRGGVLGMVASPFSSDEIAVASSVEGIVIGINKLPLVNAGEALYHVAVFSEVDVVEEGINAHGEVIETDPLYGVEQVEDVELN